MKIKLLLALLMCFTGTPAFAGENQTKTYGLHLFFDEKEFVDVLTLTKAADGSLSGHMQVPNDFEGKVENLVISGGTFSFELFVPKNAARPRDLVFSYRGRFFDKSQKQMIGFVTLKDQSDHIASFVALLREKP
jgi:hypothetical protein